jgi:hypothetical protein
LHALIIGINQYKNADGQNLTNLKGAVPDADEVDRFLILDLHVPPENIVYLRDSTATRYHILRQFQRLARDPRIQFGDPILIFYAGHGGLARAPSDWPSNSDVQMILPHDFLPRVSQEECEQGIPDLTIGALLQQIAETKGDNIVCTSFFFFFAFLSFNDYQTVIFDSCFSGSGTRSIPDLRARGVDLRLQDYQLLSTVDQEVHNSVAGDRAGHIAQGYERHGLASHVLLAGCKADETAKEFNQRGNFTGALLKLLRNRDVRLDAITYRQVIDKLDDIPYVNFTS